MSLPLIVVASVATYPEPEVTREAVCHWMAKRLLTSRDLRMGLGETRELPETAWQMLLDMFIAEQLGHKVSVTDLALAAQVPKSTGLRTAAQLVDDGYAIRKADPNDRRRHWMTLAQHTREQLDEYLVNAAKLFGTPLKGAEIRIFATNSK